MTNIVSRATHGINRLRDEICGYMAKTRFTTTPSLKHDGDAPRLQITIEGWKNKRCEESRTYIIDLDEVDTAKVIMWALYSDDEGMKEARARAAFAHGATGKAE